MTSNEILETVVSKQSKFANLYVFIFVNDFQSHWSRLFNYCVSFVFKISYQIFAAGEKPTLVFQINVLSSSSIIRAAYQTQVFLMVFHVLFEPNSFGVKSHSFHVMFQKCPVGCLFLLSNEISETYSVHNGDMSFEEAIFVFVVRIGVRRTRDDDFP